MIPGGELYPAAVGAGDEAVVGNPDGEGNVVVFQPLEPVRPDELAIGQQHCDAVPPEDRGVAFHQRDALRRLGMPGAVQHYPHQRHLAVPGADGQHQDVDASFADLPVGPVQHQSAPVRPTRQARDHRRGPVVRQPHMARKNRCSRR